MELLGVFIQNCFIAPTLHLHHTHAKVKAAQTEPKDIAISNRFSIIFQLKISTEFMDLETVTRDALSFFKTSNSQNGQKKKNIARFE